MKAGVLDGLALVSKLTSWTCLRRASAVRGDCSVYQRANSTTSSHIASVVQFGIFNRTVGLFATAKQALGHCFLLLVLLCGGLTNAHAGTQYFYDALGRLVNVLNADGSVVDYQYDANGNVTTINRVIPQTLSVVAFTPSVGHAGSILTIYGTGFSPDPNQDNVTVGGATASVSSATSTSLVATVPAAAVSGPISVTVSGVTATSSQTFTVLRPAITSFSPTLVNPGVSITLLGANLNLVSGSTSIAVGSITTTLGSLTNSQAVFTAPSGSGYVTVNTSYGQATSTTPLTVVPSAITAANVAAVAVLPTSGDVASVSISQQNKYALFEFNATQGQFLSIQLSSLTTVPSGSSVGYTVYSPTNTVIASSGISASGMTIHLPKAATTGTYLIAFNSGSNTSVQVSASVEVNAAIDATGISLSASTAIAAQSKRLTFAATAGDNLDLAITGLSLSPSSVSYAVVVVYKPDGSTWTSTQCNWSYGGCDLNLGNAPVTGTYAIVVLPGGQATLSFTATLSYDVVTALIPGSQVSAVLSRAGQNGRFTFSGTAGTSEGIQINANSVVPSGRVIFVSVLKPDGSTLVSGSGYGGYAVQMPNLPVTGTYTVFVDPQYGATANITATLVSAAGGAISVDSASQNVSGNTYGYIGFAASAGENFGIGIANIAKTSGSSSYTYLSVYVYKPDGSMWTSTICYFANGGCDLNLANAPVSGFYGVVVQSPSPSSEPNMTMSLTATVSHDLPTALTAGTPASANITRTGQNGRFTFSGTAGAAAGVQVNASSISPSGRIIFVSVLKPDGTTLVSGSNYGGYALQIPSLPTTGTYTVFIDPQYGATAIVTATLVSAGGGAIAVDGSSQNVSANTYSYFGFSATSGDNLGIGITNLVKTNGSSSFPYVNVYVYKPDGSTWTSTSCYLSNGGCDLNLSNAPSTGFYGVVVQSPSASYEPNLTMSFTATVSHDLVTALTAGTAATENITRNGQNGRFTFSGTAGAAAGVQVNASSIAPSGRTIFISVLKPDGTTLVSGSNYGGYALQIPTLPTTGTYTIFVDPQYGATANVTATLVSASGGAIAVDGSSQNVSSATYSYFGFSATAGDNLGIGIANIAKTNGSSSFPYLNVYVYKPDGSTWTSASCYLSNGGCDLNLVNAPATGFYGVVVQSPSASYEPNLTMSFTATVSHDLATALTAGTPASANISRNGQNGRFTFSGTAGAAAGIQINASSVAPSGRTIFVSVLKPDGTTLVSGSNYGGYALQIPNLPTTGTYTVFVDPQYGATTSITATLVSASGGAIAVDGGGQNISSTTYSYFGFSANTGDNLGVGITNIVKTNGSSSFPYLNVYIYKPDGSTWTSTSCYLSNGGCDLNLSNAPVTGFYGVVVQSPSASYEPNLTMSFTATVSHDLSAALTTGTPLSVSLSRYGQNGRLTFSGTAGGSATLQITSISTAPSGKTVYFTVYKPDGSSLSSNSSTTSYTFNLSNLPSTGTYVLFIDPQYGASATLQVTQQ